MSETPREMLARLQAMAADERGHKWDLSPNDRAAISWVLEYAARWLRSATEATALLARSDEPAYAAGKRAGAEEMSLPLEPEGET